MKNKINCFIRLQSENFRNRHGFFSMNVPTIADADLRILNVVARWPGSVHDSTIFANSNVRNELERGQYGDFVIVGDGGYANRPYLCTPFRTNAQLNGAQIIYQRLVPFLNLFALMKNRKNNLFIAIRSHRSQIATRNVVERSYGLLKRRFPILHSGMQLKRLELIQKVIVVCCMLHNMCIDMGDTGDIFGLIPNVEEPPAEPQPPAQPQAQPQPGGRIARDQIVDVFAQRMLEGEQ